MAPKGTRETAAAPNNACFVELAVFCAPFVEAQSAGTTSWQRLLRRRCQADNKIETNKARVARRPTEKVTTTMSLAGKLMRPACKRAR